MDIVHTHVLQAKERKKRKEASKEVHPEAAQNPFLKKKLKKKSCSNRGQKKTSKIKKKSAGRTCMMFIVTRVV